MPNDLKPCPFCGSEAKLYIQKVIGGYDYAYVICPSCKISTAKYDASTQYCAKDKAIDDWNKREANDG